MGGARLFSVQQVERIINLRAAKALGLEVPLEPCRSKDEVIE
jgi:hypothetical protein